MPPAYAAIAGMPNWSASYILSPEVEASADTLVDGSEVCGGSKASDHA